MTRSVNSSQVCGLLRSCAVAAVMAFAELQDFRADQAKMQISRSGARPAIKAEGEGPGRVVWRIFAT